MRWAGLAAVAVLVGMVVEVLVFVAVANWLGVAWALALAIATSVVGALLLRRVGVRGWRRFRDEVRAGRPPGRSAAVGLVGLVGALLLLVPGFISDVVGLVLLLPPVQWSAATLAQRLAEGRMPADLAGDIFGPRRVRARVRRPRGRHDGGPAQGGVDAGPRAVEGEVLPPD